MNSQFITRREELDQIIHSCEVCYVGMTDENMHPYVLPFNFYYDGQNLYLHSGPGGKKLEILQQHPEVCVTFSNRHELYRQHDQVACSWSMKFVSVLVFGKVELITDIEKKTALMNGIMQKYSGRTDYTYSKPAIQNVIVIQVSINQISGKTRGY